MCLLLIQAGNEGDGTHAGEQCTSKGVDAVDAEGRGWQPAQLAAGRLLSAAQEGRLRSCRSRRSGWRAPLRRAAQSAAPEREGQPAAMGVGGGRGRGQVRA